MHPGAISMSDEIVLVFSVGVHAVQRPQVFAGGELLDREGLRRVPHPAWQHVPQYQGKTRPEDRQVRLLQLRSCAESRSFQSFVPSNLTSWFPAGCMAGWADRSTRARSLTRCSSSRLGSRPPSTTNAVSASVFAAVFVRHYSFACGRRAVADTLFALHAGQFAARRRDK